MKVKKLISKLSKLDPNAEVVLASDAEGNNFSPLADICVPEEEYDTENHEFYDESAQVDDDSLNLSSAIILFPL